jgi:hypothetical protein
MCISRSNSRRPNIADEFSFRGIEGKDGAWGWGQGESQVLLLSYRNMKWQLSRTVGPTNLFGEFILTFRAFIVTMCIRTIKWPVAYNTQSPLWEILTSYETLVFISFQIDVVYWLKILNLVMKCYIFKLLLLRRCDTIWSGHHDLDYVVIRM